MVKSVHMMYMCLRAIVVDIIIYIMTQQLYICDGWAIYASYIVPDQKDSALKELFNPPLSGWFMSITLLWASLILTLLAEGLEKKAEKLLVLKVLQSTFTRKKSSSDSLTFCEEACTHLSEWGYNEMYLEKLR